MQKLLAGIHPLELEKKKREGIEGWKGDGQRVLQVVDHSLTFISDSRIDVVSIGVRPPVQEKTRYIHMVVFIIKKRTGILFKKKTCIVVCRRRKGQVWGAVNVARSRWVDECPFVPFACRHHGRQHCQEEHFRWYRRHILEFYIQGNLNIRNTKI